MLDAGYRMPDAGCHPPTASSGQLFQVGEVLGSSSGGLVELEVMH
jgi:hypothetical protein